MNSPNDDLPNWDDELGPNDPDEDANNDALDELLLEDLNEFDAAEARATIRQTRLLGKNLSARWQQILTMLRSALLTVGDRATGTDEFGNPGGWFADDTPNDVVMKAIGLLQDADGNWYNPRDQPPNTADEVPINEAPENQVDDTNSDADSGGLEATGADSGEAWEFALDAHAKETMLNDALLVAVKLRSSRVLSMRVQLRAQAAIIRQHAEGIYVIMHMFQHHEGLPEEYFNLLRDEIKYFCM